MERITTSVLLLSLISLTHANTAPVIVQTIYEVCEDTPVGELAFIINATDAENDKLQYAIQGPNANYFSVDQNSGAVSVRTPLDRESNDVLNLGLSVNDGVNTETRSSVIIMKDANDNRPVFERSSYDDLVPENTTVGATLFRVSATDADNGDAGSITYSIDEVIPNNGFGHFSISSRNGEVRLTASLNYTLNTFYRLKINASDKGGNCFEDQKKYMSNVVFAFITVKDVPDLDPIFVGLPYTTRIKENSPENEFVFKVSALDQDTGVDDDILYSIESSTVDGLFKISETDGVISVMKQFDRESGIGDVVTLTVKAEESNKNIHGVQASTTTNVTINIVDVNDEEPKFYKNGTAGWVEATEFTGEVVEHQLGSVPINMRVIDPDKTVHTELILEGEHKDLFFVQPHLSQLSENDVQLVIKNSQDLDYETIQQVVLKVIAVDKMNTALRSTATVTINILDANDNTPTFPQDTYTFDVTEHSNSGTTVATLTAQDPDTMDRDKITYRLLPASILPIFDVIPDTGRIYVKNKSLLDREIKSSYSMTLEAQDTARQIGTTVVEVTVTDINDKTPVMNRDSYFEFVREGEQLNVKIEATDSDEPNTPNSKIVYAIEPGNYSELFTIDANTGVLTNSGVLDREAVDPNKHGRIELTVTASDSGVPKLSTSVIVNITVEDVNDNSPQFDDPSYKFSVKEGEKGAIVGNVFARDLDQTTIFNRVSFRIIEGGFGNFIIQTSAENGVYRGQISVDQDVALDYENGEKKFTMQIQAADLDQKAAKIQVEVYVEDVNDERPQFEVSPPTSVRENTTMHTAVGSFKANDKDGNHSLIFELESVECRCNNSMMTCDWFILDPTGEIRVNPERTIDYEKCDQAVVTAQVVDELTEKGENNSVTPGQMVINIEDINDNAPEFLSSVSPFVVVSEGASKGTSVAQVTAVDHDSGVNSQIEFEVTAVQFEHLNNVVESMRQLFEAVTTQQKDTYVGIIQNTEGLDLTLQGKYLVTVTANDTGGLSSITTLEIFTVDESYKIELEFTSSGDEFTKKLNVIRRALMDATKAAVEIVAIKPGTDQATRVSGSTIIVAYFIFSNGTALTPDEVERMLSDNDHYPRLLQLGLRYVGQPSEEDPQSSPVQYILLGIVGGLIIVLIVLITSLLCTRRNYRRKLKAANAMKSASMMNSDQKSGAVVPGTNKYTQEGANPVLNLNIEPSIALDLDDDSLDVDKVSLNSLDNSNDGTFPEKGPKVNMLMIEEAEEDEYDKPPKYNEPLGAALAQWGQRKNSGNSLKGFTNPAFNTTDL